MILHFKSIIDSKLYIMYSLVQHSAAMRAAKRRRRNTAAKLFSLDPAIMRIVVK